MTKPMTDYMSFIHTSRYARWLDAEKRRETWEETVDRYMTNVVKPKLIAINGGPNGDLQGVAYEIQQAILNLDMEDMVDIIKNNPREIARLLKQYGLDAYDLIDDVYNLKRNPDDDIAF